MHRRRPERPCDTRVHRRRTMSRCRRIIVPGETISRIAGRGPPAASRPAAPATPGPAMSNANEREAGHAGRPRADGAASRSTRPSTTPLGATSPAATPHGTQLGKSASSPRAEDHPIPGGPRPAPSGTRTRDRANRDLQSIYLGGAGFGTHSCRNGRAAFTNGVLLPEMSLINLLVRYKSLADDLTDPVRRRNLSPGEGPL